VYRLLQLIVLAVPVVLFLRAVFPGQSKKLSQAWAELKRQLDYLVWVILAVIACAIVYSLVTVVAALF
jgi:cytochrome c oxidase assembly factor CtaG